MPAPPASPRSLAAREPLHEALALATGCGAEGPAERVRAELRASGIHVRAGESSRDVLTASEKRIAAMAAGGQSNREIAQALFVTLKTVETHLSHCYAKLGVHSRHQLPSALVTTYCAKDQRRLGAPRI
jgi:DNA-binding CsgD family transcriptional regulator